MYNVNPSADMKIHKTCHMSVCCITWYYNITVLVAKFACDMIYVTCADVTFRHNKMNHKIIVYQYLHILHMNICLQYLNMLPDNGHKKNNIYIYTLTYSCKQVILHSRSCKYITHIYVYRIKAYQEWSEEPLVQ